MKNIRENTKEFEILYWTDKDDRIGSCSPSGRTKQMVSEKYNPESFHSLKKFKRKNGNSRIYDISLN